MSRHLLIAAGGTGGHMFPAQALAEAMLGEGWRVTLSTDKRGASHSQGFPAEVSRRVVSSATFARGGMLAKLAAAPRIIAGIWAARSALARDRPTVVAGFGGYPAIPAMSAAWLLGLPRLVHEQNAVLGRVNRVFATRVHKVACSLWPTDLPASAKAVHTGNPVRSAIRDRAGAAYPALDGRLSVLVIGGSQGASILSRVVPNALAKLPEDLQSRLSVSHQARAADSEEVLATYATAGIEHDVKPFFDDVPERLVQAHLVISRAGASSVADITAIGRPAIFVPLAIAIRDEQTANAAPVVAAGGAIAIQEPEFTEGRLAADIAAILSDPPRAHAMADAARSLGRPDAADRLKEVVLELAEQT